MTEQPKAGQVWMDDRGDPWTIEQAADHLQAANSNTLYALDGIKLPTGSRLSTRLMTREELLQEQATPVYSAEVISMARALIIAEARRHGSHMISANDVADAFRTATKFFEVTETWLRNQQQQEENV